MNLALLAPAALGLLALGLGPVLAHLTRQVIREERPFGATLLLERLKTRLERRRRLADRALLILRVAALLLALLALTRPQLSWPETQDDLGGSGRVLIVLDTSLSMDQRGVEWGEATTSAFDAARAAAVETLEGLPPGTRVAAIRTAPPEVISAWSEGSGGDVAALAADLTSVQRTDAAGDLHGALVLARGLMGGEPAELVIFTDEAGPGQVTACDEDLERILAVGGSVIPRVFAPAEAANIAVSGAEYGDGIEGGTVSVKLQNFGAAREVTTTLTLPDGGAMTSFASLGAASELGPTESDVRFTVPRQAEGGIASITVEDADLPADNLRFFHLPRIGASRVLVVDGDPGSTPTRSETYFLERALSPVGLGRPAVDVVAPSGIALLDPKVHRVVWMANVADPAAMMSGLLGFVRGGGGLVIGLGDGVTAGRYNTAMESLLPMPLRKVRDLDDGSGTPGVALAAGEQSELLEPFARRPAGLSRVRARRVMTVEAPQAAEPGLGVLLRWGDGIPALIERKVGAGTVLLWTGTLDLDWGNFPVEAVFPAFVERVTSVLGGETAGRGRPQEGIVGEGQAVAVAPDSPELELAGPGGKLRAAERGIGELRFVPDVAGPWTVSGADGALAVSVAVNTPASESDIRRDVSILARQAALTSDERMIHFDLLPVLAGLAAIGLLIATIWAAIPVRQGGQDAPA